MVTYREAATTHLAQASCLVRVPLGPVVPIPLSKTPHELG